MSTPLYNLEILRLAASTADLPRTGNVQTSVEKRSPACGSTVRVGVSLDESGRVTTVGVDVHACALGQASTALMAAHATGSTPGDLAEACDRLRAYLEGQRPDPGGWPGLDVFAPARAHHGRHAAILLAFAAAAEAAALAAKG